MYLMARWFMANIAMLQRALGPINFDDVAYRWFRVERMPLPPVYWKRETKLLTKVPYPNLSHADGYNFYSDQYLSRRDGAVFQHIKEHAAWNDESDLGYARISFHLTSFNPSPDMLHGDTFIDLMESVYNFLGQEKGKV
ncbi:MAG: hypothetical protein KQJ78_25930 [Deltaproteobacteria bacterium]|nr:hypothetical protein [Deltaproteobacteria bacterium]